MTRRRITSVVMVLVLVCSLMVVYTPGVANAEEPAEEENIYKEELLQTQYTYGDWTYEVLKDDHSKCSIVKYNGTDTNVVIPASLAEKEVVGINDYSFQHNKNIQSVYIPDSVQDIGAYAFHNCSTLAEVRFPKGITRIPHSCFNNCDSLTTMVIPESVEIIDMAAFAYCSSLESLSIGRRVRTIANAAFSDCDSLQSVVLPASLFTEGSYAANMFSGCDSLKNINIEDGGVIVPKSMFFNITGLESITLPNSIECISINAFEKCSNLNIVKLGSNVKQIGNSAFKNTYNLKDFYNYSMDTEYPKGLFNDAGLVTLHGLKGSTTEAYASQYNIPFVPLPDTAMLRMYNPYSGEHLYTSDQNEKEYLQISGWNYEGLAWIESSKAKAPVYRLYNPLSGEHHYTMDEGEKDYLAGIGWNYEGVGWKSSDDGTPVYRLFNPNNPGTAAHHYTTDKHEKEVLVSNGWNDEGIGWYGL